MFLFRPLSVAAANPATRLSFPTPILSEVVKQLSKFSSHDELLEYSQRPVEHCYANRLIDACSPAHATPVNLVETASALHDQLLVRIAHGICYFQSLPFLPAANPILLSLHERYLKLFEHLAHFPRIQTAKDEELFAHLITRFIRHTDDVIGQLSSGCREAQKYFKSYTVMQEFLDHILQNRLSMRLLAEHYLALHDQRMRPAGDDSWRGAISMQFQPVKTVQQCIDDVASICFDTYGVVPRVQIDNHLHQPLPYFSSVVEYILRELLKNSMRALVEYHKVTLGSLQNVKRYFEEHQEAPLCHISITADADDEHFMVAIKDQGGGIDESNEQLFRYMFTGKGRRPSEVDGASSRV